jgi:hypothetical protein
MTGNRKTMSNGERTWQGLPPVFDGAAASTVEAIMLELRTYGIEQLKKENTKRRLSELSDRQLREVIQRLVKLQSRYPQIGDKLIFALQEKLK